MSLNQMWVEKYRPKTIDDCILPEAVKEQARGMIADGGAKMPHLLLAGTQGTGKTTLAKAICAELDADWIEYNGSDGSLNIEELRENVRDFASTVSMKGKDQLKVVIIDEADGLNWNIQPALRNAMEKYSKNCRFILTCNYLDKIIQPLQSRCATIDFKFEKSEVNGLVQGFARRAYGILKEEKVSCDANALSEVVRMYWPDNRKILNELQRYANQKGCIDEQIIYSMQDSIADLFKAIKDKDFAATKNWVVENAVSSIFNTLYREGEKHLDKSLLPLWIMKLGDYQRYHGVVPNQELNVLCCLTEFMAES